MSTRQEILNWYCNGGSGCSWQGECNIEEEPCKDRKKLSALLDKLVDSATVKVVRVCPLTEIPSRKEAREVIKNNFDSCDVGNVLDRLGFKKRVGDEHFSSYIVKSSSFSTSSTTSSSRRKKNKL